MAEVVTLHGGKAEAGSEAESVIDFLRRVAGEIERGEVECDRATVVLDGPRAMTIRNHGGPTLECIGRLAMAGALATKTL